MGKDKRKRRKRHRSRSKSSSQEEPRRIKSKRSNDYSSNLDTEVEELQQRLNELKWRQRSRSRTSDRQNRSKYGFNRKNRQRSWDRSSRGATTVRGSRSPAESSRVRNSRSSSRSNLDRGSRSPTSFPNNQVTANVVLGQSPPPVEISSPQIVPTISLGAVDLPESVKACLGEDPENITSKLFEPHPELVKRINYIIAKSLDKEVKVELLSKYAIPKSVNMGAPALNPEIAASMGPVALTKDKYQVNIQDDLGQGIGCVMLAVHKMLLDERPVIPKIEYIPLLSDILRHLSDLQHTLSLQRRSFINNGLSKAVVDLAASTPVGTLLYGQDFGEKIKAVKMAERSAKEMATTQGRPRQLVVSNQSSGPFRTRNLNSFRPSRYRPRDHRQQGQFSENFNPRYKAQRHSQAYQTKRFIQPSYQSQKKRK